MKAILATTSLGLALLSLSPFTPAASLVTNGHFDQNTSAWLVPFPENLDTFQWLSIDANSDPQSGSIELTDVGTGNGGTQRVASQCVPIDSVLGESLRMRASALIPSTGPSGISAWVMLDQYSDDQCVSAIAFGPDFRVTFEQDLWAREGLEFLPYQDTRAIRINLGVYKPDGETADARILFDAIELVGERIFVDGLEP